MIIDAHVHLSETEYGNINILLEQMSITGIDKAVLVPGGMLDVRRLTNYVRDIEKPATLTPPNDLIENAIHKYPAKFYGFVCVDPHWGDNAITTLEKYVKKGFVGLKLAPMVHKFALSNKYVKMLAEKCGNLNIPFYTHVTYSPASSTTKVGQLAKEFPDTNFILGHMGFGNADPEAVELASNYDNFYLETSDSSYIIVKEALEKAGPDKLIFGSEFPLHHPAAELKKIEMLELNNNDKNKILCDNILKLIPK